MIVQFRNQLHLNQLLAKGSTETPKHPRLFYRLAVTTKHEKMTKNKAQETHIDAETHVQTHRNPVKTPLLKFSPIPEDNTHRKHRAQEVELVPIYGLHLSVDQCSWYWKILFMIPKEKHEHQLQTLRSTMVTCL